MDRKKELFKKLDRRLAKGEISEELYNEIASRYEDEDEQEEEKVMDEEQVEEASTKKKIEKESEKTERISISGATKINGCNCEIFRAAGASKISGDLRADDADISGATKIKGDAFFEKLDSSGSLKINGTSEGKRLDLSGSSKFEKSIKVDSIESSGSFKAEGNVECSTMSAKGSVGIRGVLKGDEIMLKMSGKCKIKKIEGGNVVVESGDSKFFTFGFRKSGSLEVDSIKGNEIYLENTKAKSVIGDKVVVGPGCDIRTAKAKDLKISESAKVENKKSLSDIERK